MFANFFLQIFVYVCRNYIFIQIDSRGIGPALGQRLVFAGNVDKPHYVLHIGVVLNGIINYASYRILGQLG